MNDEWLLFLLTGFVAGILIIKTSPIWVAGYQWFKTIIPRIKEKHYSWTLRKQWEKEENWANNPDLCTSCGSGFQEYKLKANQPFSPHWAVGRYCLNPNNSHYWIARQSMTEEQARIFYNDNLAKLEKRKIENGQN